MTQSKSQLRKIASFAATATALQVLESMIPHPIPGVRLGLANILTLLALVHLGFRAALQVTMLRVLLSSLLIGTFLSPGFALSASGGLASACMMALAWHTCMKQRQWLGWIGVSLIGSMTHNLTQIGVVYLFLMPHRGLLLLLPWLGLSAVLMGWLTGGIAYRVSCMLNAGDNRVPGQFRGRISSNSGQRPLRAAGWIIALSVRAKLIFLSGVGAALFINQSMPGFGMLALLILTLYILGHVSVFGLFRKMKRLSPILLFALIMPVLLTRHGEILFHWKSLMITQNGLSDGLRFSMRLTLLLSCTSLLSWTTTPEMLTQGFNWLLTPLHLFGIRPHGFSELLSAVWTTLPETMAASGSIIKAHVQRGLSFKNIIPVMSEMITDVYWDSHQTNFHNSRKED